MLSSLRKLFTPATSSARDAGRSRRKPTGHARPALEMLERRDLLSAGFFDPTFGSGGRVAASYNDLLGPSASASAVAVQPDGKIVVAGTVAQDANHEYFAVMRLNANGIYDATFGLGGRQYFTFSDLLGGTHDDVKAMTIDPQGRIVVAGTAETRGGGYDFAVGRLNANGWFDTTFGLHGRQYFTFSDRLGSTDAIANAVAIDAQGRIVLAGTAVADAAHGHGTDFALARLNTNGWFDTTFGLHGRQYFTFSDLLGSTSDYAHAVAIDAQGRIVLAGSASTPYNRGTDFAVARLGTTGWFDTTFGLHGRQYFTFSDLLGGTDDSASSVAIDAQGRVVLAGSATTTHNGGGMDFAVGRLNANGWFDTTFGLRGRQYFTFSDMLGVSASSANAVAIDKQGRIVLAGTAQADAGHGGGSDFAVARLNASGWFDTTFGWGGRQYVTFDNLGGRYDYASAVALDWQGNVVIAGEGRSDIVDSVFAVTRLQG
jgi:uncharacterized delta-60 repeat protein